MSSAGGLTDDELKRRQVSGCIRAYLEGRQSLVWTMPFVRGTHLPPDVLTEVISGVRAPGDDERHAELIAKCTEEGFLG